MRSIEGCFLPRLVEIGPVVLEKMILNILNSNLQFRYYFPFKKGVALRLNKVESTLPKDALCQVWMKLAELFWRIVFKYFQIKLHFRHYLHLEKGVALHLIKL